MAALDDFTLKQVKKRFASRVSQSVSRSQIVLEVCEMLYSLPHLPVAVAVQVVLNSLNSLTFTS